MGAACARFSSCCRLPVALCSASTAGDNAGVVVSIDGDTEISGVGAGATVEVALSAAGMVGKTV